MHRCLLNPALERVRVNGFAFPLGVYPVEPIAPTSGYTVDFEPADGDEEWEEWPDRYVYEILVSAERLKPLCSALLSLLPGRIYPILDVLGNDAFREIDPYIAYELVGVESLYDGLRWYEPFLFEDGLCGFGAMSEEPFMYLFLDEHKVLTVRVETSEKERVDRLLAAFELPNLGGVAEHGPGRPRRQGDQPPVEVMAADAVSHEHRSVLLTPDDRPELPGPEEVAEALVDLWGMTLNIDVERNLDDDGRELGVTGWRCLVRVDPPMPAEGDQTAAARKASAEGGGEGEVEGKGGGDRGGGRADQAGPRVRYAEVLLAARCWREAEDLAVQAVEKLPEAPRGVSVADGFGPRLISADRLWRRELASFLSAPAGRSGGGGGGGGEPSPPEAHLARSSEPAPLVTPPPEHQPSAGASPAGGQRGQDAFEDDASSEPPEIARLLDEALANDAAGRILASRWLE